MVFIYRANLNNIFIILSKEEGIIKSLSKITKTTQNDQNIIEDNIETRKIILFL